MGRARALCLAGLVLFVASGCMRRRGFPPPMAPDVAMPAPTPPAPGSLWRADLANNYPFVDVRARFPGDLLTVIVAEQSSGKKDGTTEASAQSSIFAAVQAFFGIPAAAVKLLPGGFNPEQIVQAETRRESVGDAETKRSGTLTASITVTVIGVDPNGNLHVQGDKIVSVNREDQHIVLSGRVRPVDIGPDNSVLSSRLADARIDYYGRGVVGDKQNVPLVHRLYDWIWPF